MSLKYNIKKFLSIITVLLISNSIVIAEEFEAHLIWSQRVELSTPVSGVVQKVYVESGKNVAKGEVLIQLDPRTFKADLKYAKAKLKNANEQNKEAKRELDRQLDMYDRDMLSDHELQIAKNNFTSARALYHQAQAALIKAKINLEYSAIRAPFNAIVIKTTAVKGQVVASEITPPILVVVAEAQKILARFYVTIDKVNSFVINQEAKVNIADHVFSGKIYTIALEQEQLKLGQYAVDVIFDSENKVLRAGQKVTVNL
ncbi:MAG: efflux RND transporter periplasmic adaptor subunit [Gammaproteobacteria bacterium]|nr:efflux RND transporter periplasmic adaptor subunit [Gammaproteobacteria bacterium]